jgi:hypothetical protein
MTAAASSKSVTLSNYSSNHSVEEKESMSDYKEPKKSASKVPSRNPYASAGFFSLITFSFANQIINRIFKRGHVERSDVYPIT